MKNYYEMLGVSYTATRQEIKKAYLAILKQYHPDIFKGNKQIAQDYSAKLNVAFDTLSNSAKRLDYDKSIFPPQLTASYTYDNEGLRVAIQVPTKKGKKKSVPAFSFFGENTISEKVSKVLRRTAEEKQQIKKEKQQAKKLSKIAKKTNRQNEKKKKLQLKQRKKQLKQEKKSKLKKSLSQEKLYQKNKRKLDVSIIVITCILIVFFAFMAYLNIAYGQ